METVIVEKEIIVNPPEEFTIDETELKKLNLNSREYEVLHLLAKGYGNAAIAKNLFLSLSTIKTHVSNLYSKMDVKSTTQAITKAKRLKSLNDKTRTLVLNALVSEIIGTNILMELFLLENPLKQAL